MIFGDHSAVVSGVEVVCDRKGVENPVICSESGSLVGQLCHTTLIFDAVLSSMSTPSPPASTLVVDHLIESLTEDARGDYHNLRTAVMKGEYDRCLFYSDHLKQRCIDQFKEAGLRN